MNQLTYQCGNRAMGFLLFIVLMFSGLMSFSQTDKKNPPSFFNIELQNTSAVPLYKLPELDIDSLKKVIETSEHTDCRSGGIWGYNNQVEVNLLKDGHVNVLSNGDKVYRYSFHVSYAYGLQLHFSSFHVPERGEIYLYNDNKTMSVGPLSSEANESGGAYAIKPVTGNTVTIEYLEPAGITEKADVVVSTVVADFVGVYKIAYSNTASEIDACTDNAICNQSMENYDKMVRSSALWLFLSSGQYSKHCSGTFLNNSLRDGTPYFASSEHCVKDAIASLSTSVFLVDYESSTCYENTIDPNAVHYISGADRLIFDQTPNGVNGDYLLLRLHDKPPMSYKVCYAGWDASDKPSLPDGDLKVGVHHPASTLKRISTTYKATMTMDFSSFEASGLPKISQFNLLSVAKENKYWYYIQWNGDGVTAPGSSGSALFNGEGNYVGNLNSGLSGCTIGENSSRVWSGPDYPDRYGRFSENFKNGNYLPFLAPDWTNADLVQNNYKLGEYCPYKEYSSHCSNGVKDADEESVDCGGSCIPCKLASNPGSETAVFELASDKEIVFVNEEINFSLNKNFSGTNYNYLYRYIGILNPSMEKYPVSDPYTDSDPVSFGSKGKQDVVCLLFNGPIYDNSGFLNEPVNRAYKKIYVGEPSYTTTVDLFAHVQYPGTYEFVTFSPILGGILASDVLAYRWDFGEGVVCGKDEFHKKNPTVSWSTDGPKDITLTIIDKNYFISRKVKLSEVIVRRSMSTSTQVNFSIENNPSEVNESVTFTDLTMGVDHFDASYNWSFGDGFSSVDVSPRHTYYASGTYTVTLEICTSSGCKSASQTITIIEKQPISSFVINGIPWKEGECWMSWYWGQNVCDPEPDPFIEVGMNTIATIDMKFKPHMDASTCYWDFDLGECNPEMQSNTCGVQKVNFKQEGTYLIEFTAPNSGTSIMNNVTKVKVVAGKGPIGCSGKVDKFSLSTTCWNGTKPEFTVSLKETKCVINFRIVGSKSGSWEMNKTTLDYFNSSTVFPYTETFSIQAVHYDGVKITVMDEREVTYTFHSAYAQGGNFNICPGTPIQIGMAPANGKQYSWAASPSSAVSYLSNTKISNPTVNIINPGNYGFTFVVKDLTSGCVGSNNVMINVNPISVTESTAEVSKDEAINISAAAQGGTGVFPTYTWNPSTILSAINKGNATFSGTQVPGTYAYNLVVTDHRGCTGTGKQTVEVSATAPSGLIVNTTVSKLWLTWVDNAENETSYNVLRSSTLNGTYSVVATIPANSVYYLDASSNFGVEYFYRIQAFNGTKNLGLSNKAKGIREFETINTKSITASGDFQVRDVLKLTDGSYMMIGSKNYDFCLVKLNDCGGIEWEKTYGGNRDDIGSKIIQTPDGGFLIAGTTHSDPSGDHSQSNGACFCTPSCGDWYLQHDKAKADADYWVLKVSGNGTKQWEKSYRGFWNDVLTTITPAADGGYYIGGTSETYLSSELNICLEKGEPLIHLPNGKVVVKYVGVGLDDYWVVKIAADGTLQWDKIYGSLAYDNLKKIMEMPDGTVLLLGTIDNLNGIYNIGDRTNQHDINRGGKYIWMVRINRDGTQQWDRTIGGLNYQTDFTEFVDFIRMSDGTYRLYANVKSGIGNDITVAGRGGYDYWCFEMSASLVVTKSYRFGGSGDDKITHVTKTDNKLTMYGGSQSPLSGDKAMSTTGTWMVETDLQGNKTNENAFPLSSIVRAFKVEDGLYHLFYNTSGAYADYKIYSDPETYKFLQANSVNPLNYYLGDVMNVPFTAKRCVGAGNVYTAQLSDENGSFDAARNLGALAGNMLTGNIVVTIPFNVTPGNSYRVRVISSAPAYEGFDNGEYITIKAPEIETKKINPLTYLEGSTLNVPFVLHGNVQSNNVFKVELSDAQGSFLSPVVLGSFAGTASATYPVTIPNGVTWSTQYRVRVTASTPATIGSDNGENISIGSLFTMNPLQTQYNKGDQIYIAYETLLKFNTGNVFSLQLSDENGSFANPTVIGTAKATSSGSIAGTLPVSIANGVHYKVRVVGASPAVVGMSITNEITIAPQEIFTYSISPLQYTVSDPMDIYYSAKGGFNSDNQFVIQLSDENGTFVQPIVLATFTGYNSGKVTVTLPDFVNPGTQYRVRVLSTSPEITGGDNGEDITISPLFTGKISPLVYNAGSSIQIPYVTKFSFDSENVFTAELSDKNGSFSHPLVIGTLQNTGQGTILGVLPNVLTPGTGYRVRVKSSSPRFIANDNGENISVNPPTVILDTMANATLCRVNPLAFTYRVNGNFASDNAFVLQLSDDKGSFTHPKYLGHINSAISDTVFAIVLDSAIAGGKDYKIRLVSSNPLVISNEVPYEIQNAWITSDKAHVLCTGETLRLNTYLATGQTAVWYKGTEVFKTGGAYVDVADSGLYHVVVSDVSGCSVTSKPFGVMKFETPVVTVEATPSTMCEIINEEYTVLWTPVKGTTVNSAGNIITSTADQAKGTSLHYLDGDGTLFYVAKGGDDFILALSELPIVAGDGPPAELRYSFAFFLTRAEIWFNGMQSSIPSFNIKADDTLKISRNGNVIAFYKNSTKIHQLNGVTSRLWVNVFFGSKAKSCGDVKLIRKRMIAFTANVTNLTAPYSLRWYNNQGTIAGNVSSLSWPGSNTNPVFAEITTSHICGDKFTAKASLSLVREPARDYILEVQPDNQICDEGDAAPKWTNRVNVDTVGGVIKKSNSSNSWNAGAVSLASLSVNQYVQMPVQLNTYAIGLSYAGNNSNSYTGSNYTFVRNESGVLSIYEAGVLVKNIASNKSGDLLHVGLESGRVVYYINKVLVHNSSRKVTGPLYVDVAVYNNTFPLSIKVITRKSKSFVLTGLDNQPGRAKWYVNGILAKDFTGVNHIFNSVLAPQDEVKLAYISDNTCENKIFASAVKLERTLIVPEAKLFVDMANSSSVCNGPGITPITWTNVQNGTVGPNNELRSKGSTFTAIGYSAEAISTGGVEYTFNDQLGGTRMIGFCTSAYEKQETEIPLGFWIINQSFLIEEKGKLIRSLPLPVSGTVLRISVEKNNIRYFVNNVLVHTSAIAPFANMRVIAMASTSISNVKVYTSANLLGYYAVMKNQGSNPDVNWYVNSKLVQKSGSSYFYSGYLFPNDVVHYEVLNRDECAYKQYVASNSHTVKGVVDVALSFSSPVLCSGETVTASVPFAQGATYQWLKNTVNIAGANSNSIVISESGTYAVRVTNKGCTSTSASKNFTLVNFVNVSLPAETNVCVDNDKSVISLTADQRTYLNFDGVNSAISRSDYVDLKSNFTLEFWMNPTKPLVSSGQARYPYVVGAAEGATYWGTGHTGVGIACGTNGIQVHEKLSGPNNVRETNFTSNISGWHHVALVYLNGAPALYMDGVLKGQWAASTNIPHLSPNLGGNEWGRFQGGIDDMSIWSVGKTAAEIQADYTKKLNGNEPNLVSYWMMDEGNGFVLNDLSANKKQLPINATGVSWKGFLYTWNNNQNIIENYGSRIVLGRINQPSAFTVTVMPVGITNGCSTQRSTQVNLINQEILQVTEASSVCVGKTIELFAERFPYFNGNAGSIVNTSMKIPANNQVLSYSLWVKLDADVSGEATIFSAGSMFDGTASYVSGATKKLYLQSGYNTSSTYSDAVDFTPYFGKWTHLLFVFGDVQNPYRAIYINGTQVSRTNVNNRTGFDTYSLSIGGCFSQRSMKGSIRDFRLYTAELNSLFIQNLAMGYSIGDQHLYLRFPLTEGKGNFAYDKSFNKYVAEFYDAVEWKNDDSRFSNITWTPDNISGHQFTKRVMSNSTVSVSGISQNGCSSLPAVVSLNLKNDCPTYNAANFQRKDNAITSGFINAYEFNEGDFTIEAKVKFNTGDRGGAVISGRASGGYLLVLYTGLGGQGGMVLQMNTSVGNGWYNLTANSFPAIDDGLCHHIAVVRNKGYITFILDGKTTGVKAVPVGWGLFKKSNNYLYTGYDNSDKAFIGEIFETRLWNVARTFDQINANEDVKLSATETNLVADWSIEEYDGQLIHDRSKNNNTAYLGFSPAEEGNDPELLDEFCTMTYEISLAGMLAPSSQLEVDAVDSNNLAVLIFPNPSDEKGTNITVYSSEESSFVRVINITGMVLEERVLANNQRNLILVNQVPGVYLVHIQSGKNSVVKRVVLL